MNQSDESMVSAFLDGELTAADRDAFEAARAADPAVAAEVAAIDEVRSLVRGLAPPVPPAGFLDSLLDDAGADATVVPLAPRRRHRLAAGLAGAAAAAAVLLAIVVPGAGRTEPPLATDVRIHQAGSAATGDPVSGLAPLATPLVSR